jgi:hypothetical protein
MVQLRAVAASALILGAGMILAACSGTVGEQDSGGSTPGGSTPGGSTPGGSTPGGSTPGALTVRSAMDTATATSTARARGARIAISRSPRRILAGAMWSSIGL